MTKQKSKMICKKCGAEMNHHADKLVDPGRYNDGSHINSLLGGMILEMHCCPECGAVDSRSEE
jgi:hypothetical protein